MDAKLEQWLIPLKDLVAKINTEYARLFQKLGYEGRMLSEPEDRVGLVFGDHLRTLLIHPFQYKTSEYGINILVKFRDSSQLTRLDRRTQSGGERSVSTMLSLMLSYLMHLCLMALQNICHVPFRCVDEINLSPIFLRNTQVGRIPYHRSRQPGRISYPLSVTVPRRSAS